MSIRLTALPRPATEDDYAQAGAELDEALTTLPGALAVYRYGSISTPGISDLDRVVVVEPGRAVPNVWTHLSERTRYLAMHTPSLADTRTFEQHRCFAELGEPEHVWGERIAFEPRPAPDYSEPLLSAEALVVAFLKLSKLAVTGVAKVRPLLSELAKLELDLRLARLARDQAPRAWALGGEVAELRSAWWSLGDAGRREQMLDLVGRAPTAAAEALTALGARTGGRPGSGRLRLDGGWRNVTLVAGDTRPPRPAPFSGGPRRLGEARWRSLRRTVAVPPGVLALLTDAPPGYEERHAERREIVRRYAALLALSPGYSSIGLATLFLPR